MKHLLFVLLCIPLTVVGQYNYIQPQANVNVHEMWEVAPLQYNRYNRPKSRQEFNSGIIFTRDRLMDHIYPDGRVVSDRTIDSHIRKLRRKINDLLPGMEIIKSVYSVGYKFELIEPIK